jgi:hypothetical protein
MSTVFPVPGLKNARTSSAVKEAGVSIANRALFAPINCALPLAAHQIASSTGHSPQFATDLNLSLQK